MEATVTEHRNLREVPEQRYVDFSSIGRRMGSTASDLKLKQAGKPMRGYWHGSILIFQPHYNVITGRWSTDTLLVLSR